MNLIFFSVSRWPYYPLIDKHLDGLTFEKKTNMGELQATVELSVEFQKFYNVDLFQRG